MRSLNAIRRKTDSGAKSQPKLRNPYFIVDSCQIVHSLSTYCVLLIPGPYIMRCYLGWPPGKFNHQSESKDKNGAVSTEISRISRINSGIGIESAHGLLPPWELGQTTNGVETSE